MSRIRAVLSSMDRWHVALLIEVLVVQVVVAFLGLRVGDWLGIALAALVTLLVWLMNWGWYITLRGFKGHADDWKGHADDWKNIA